MYANLVKINLANYLDSACGGKNWVEDQWLKALDNFVSSLTEKNRNVIKSKIKDNLDHIQTNDIVNELMIACAYHPKARFIEEDNQGSYDLFDETLDLKIEVKSLNEGDDEKERHKSHRLTTQIHTALTNTEKESQKQIMQQNIRKKCLDHLNKAAKQISNEGKIYLVYDYNLLTSKEPITSQNNQYHPSPLSGENACNIIEDCIKEFSNKHPKISLEAVYFGDLREKCVLSFGHSPHK